MPSFIETPPIVIGQLVIDEGLNATNLSFSILLALVVISMTWSLMRMWRISRYRSDVLRRNESPRKAFQSNWASGWRITAGFISSIIGILSGYAAYVVLMG